MITKDYVTCKKQTQRICVPSPVAGELTITVHLLMSVKSSCSPYWSKQESTGASLAEVDVSHNSCTLALQYLPHSSFYIHVKMFKGKPTLQHVQKKTFFLQAQISSCIVDYFLAIYRVSQNH